MNKYFYLPALLIIAIFFMACDKEVENVKLPEVPPKLVVYSYISPVDTVVSASVSMSVPIFNNSGGTSLEVSDAIVIISDEIGNHAQLIYDNLLKLYTCSTSAFPITAGEKYFLKVSTPDGKAVDANCTVPLINNSTLQFVSLDSIEDQYNNKEYRLRVSFRDIVNQQNYYRIFPLVKLVNYDNQGVQYFVYQQMWFTFGTECTDDKDKDGQTFSFTLNFSMYNDPQNINSDVIDCFKVYLIHADKEYYEFHNSISNYQGENPFSEPSLIYSNINGGYGVFGGYNPFELIIDR